MWERLAKQFKIHSCDYYNKLNAMIQDTGLASWKLWYRAIAVSPVLLLDPRFIRTDRSISAKELLSVSLTFFIPVRSLEFIISPSTSASVSCRDLFGKLKSFCSNPFSILLYFGSKIPKVSYLRPWKVKSTHYSTRYSSLW